MPRRVNDIIPADRRSIREISVPKRTSVKSGVRVKKDIPENDVQEAVREEMSPKSVWDKIAQEKNEQPFAGRNTLPARRMPITPPSMDTKPRRIIGKWPIIALIIVVGIGVAGYFASAYYSQAVFTIVPKVIPVVIDNSYVAQGDPQSAGLTYEVITVKSSATTTVPSTNGPVTNTKATGKVVLYNSYSDKSSLLVAGTRLAGENGLVYRLTSSVSIPGYTKSGANIIPGKITANIIADQPGQNYNVILGDQPIDLNIVAYKGSPRYTTMHATLSTNVTGGFSGVKKVIAPATLSSSTDSLKAKITEDLLAKAKASVPEGFVMYDKNHIISFSSANIGGDEATSATVNMEGTMHAIILPKAKLAEAFAGAQAISLFAPFSYTAPGIESLNVTITNLKDFSLTKKTALILQVKGNMKIVGTVPVEEIKNKLAGMELKDTQEVFKSYSPVIESSSGELAPPWANIPTDLEKVKVVIEEP